jgi:hypothetical protein
MVVVKVAEKLQVQLLNEVTQTREEFLQEHPVAVADPFVYF